MNKQILINNVAAPEGPVILDDGSFLFVEMQSGNITHYNPVTNERRIIAKTGRPNGLAVDRNGIIWCAESENPPSLMKITLDGEVEVFLDNCNGLPFLFPNDLAFGPDGLLYMTDSGIMTTTLFQNGTVRSDFNTIPYDGRVYCINTETKEISLVDNGIKFTNGIAFGPDDMLYANETRTGNVYRYRKTENGYSSKTRELFGNVWLDDGRVYVHGPDGMKFAESGNLYCAVHGQGDVCVLAPDGSVKERIMTGGKRPTNVVFGSDSDLYVTEVEQGVIERYSLKGEKGFPLYK